MPETARLSPAMIVTCGRIALAVPFTACFFLPAPWPVWGAGVLFVLAGVSDALDGWLARRLDAVTELGAILDPVADKIVHAAALVMLAADGRVHPVAAAVLLGRDFLVGGLRESDRARKVMTVSPAAKAKTLVQFAALAALLLAPGIPGAGWVAGAGAALLWVAVALSLWSGCVYVARAVRALSSSPEES